MMSLLILNQKVLYLVLLITLLYGLTSANQNITIYVQEDGIDQSECMEGNESIPCHTLSYVLNQINNRSNDTFNGTNISVYVYITYYQEITNLSGIQLLVNLYLIGVDNPILDFSGIHDFFSLYGGGSFYAENITYYKISISFHFVVTMSFNKCIFTNGDSTLSDIQILHIEDIYNLTISNCLFHNNYAQSVLIGIQNVSNVEISGCEFYQNKGQDALIWIGFRQVHNLTISNCLFHNNDAQSALIMSARALNVEISGCEFYQNEGQHYLIVGFLSLFVLMDNCSIYGNDIKNAIFQLESSKSESVFIITNCQFYNNTSGGNILEIRSNRLLMSKTKLISNKIKWVEYSIIRITAILPYYEQNLILDNIYFINNTGTGLKLKEVSVEFNNIIFYNNTGVYGGGMSLYDTHIRLNGPLIFERNTALFGGAIYIATAEVFVKAYCTSFEQISFSNNFGSTLGDDAFIEDGFSVSDIIHHTFPCINETIPNHAIRGDHIISGPYNITIYPQSNSTITLFPGQKLTYSAKVTDYFGNLTSCLVNINLECGNNFCENVQLTGDAQSLLSTSNFTTNLYLTSNVEHHDYLIKLRFLCLDTNVEVYANVNLTTCPLGYVFQTSQTSQPIQRTCECVDIVSDDVQCDFVLAVACIRHGYWLGKIIAHNAQEDTLIDTAPCQYPYCKTDLSPCPIIGLSQTYNQLPMLIVFIIKLQTMATLCYFSTCSCISTCSRIWDCNTTKSKL